MIKFKNFERERDVLVASKRLHENPMQMIAVQSTASIFLYTHICIYYLKIAGAMQFDSFSIEN